MIHRFAEAITKAIEDVDVAGFKSVICYRVGLAIPARWDFNKEDSLSSLLEHVDDKFRLQNEQLNYHFVHQTMSLLRKLESKKPIQFHTGLGDNDMNLDLSNPAHLQPFIEEYSRVSIVLLHASYPFTTQAGYLASLYDNCYLDIGEVFPMISQDGQEKVIREALELCPSSKLMWSTGKFL